MNLWIYILNKKSEKFTPAPAIAQFSATIPHFFAAGFLRGIPTIAILKNPITIIKFIKFFYLGTMKKYTRLQIYKERKN